LHQVQKRGKEYEEKGIYIMIKLSKKSGAGQKREGGKRFERRKD
jgi:hypothetical protein